MQLELKIYEGKEVIKTYTAETLDFSFGVIEDILDALDFEHIKNGDKTELAGIVIKCSKQLKPFLRDVFPGVTDAELRATRLQNLIDIFRGIFQYATAELGKAAGPN